MTKPLVHKERLSRLDELAPCLLGVAARHTAVGSDDASAVLKTWADWREVFYPELTLDQSIRGLRGDLSVLCHPDISFRDVACSIAEASACDGAEEERLAWLDAALLVSPARSSTSDRLQALKSAIHLAPVETLTDTDWAFLSALPADGLMQVAHVSGCTHDAIKQRSPGLQKAGLIERRGTTGWHRTKLGQSVMKQRIAPGS